MNRQNVLNVIVFLSFFLIGTTSASADDNSRAYMMMRVFQQSYISANVPDSADFSRFLNRDLCEYFKKQLRKPVSIECELLRKEPTQSGVSCPKYYAWVVVFDGTQRINSGAVRLAAVDKKRFEITDFLSVDEIMANPDLVETVFPILLCPDIRKRAGLGGPSA